MDGIAVRVSDETELAEVLRCTAEPVLIKGGATRAVEGAWTPLDLSALAGIVEYEPGALTLVARAATRLADIEAVLNAEGQRLAFEPADWSRLLDTRGTPTIGGMVATNISGPRRVIAGAVRDSLLGVRFIDGTGMMVRNGGRVMKNVTGYDLSKLLAGSWGTVGVLTEVALKVLPAPETEWTLRIDSLSPEAAVNVMASALGTPWEVNGAARLPGGTVLLRIDGFEESVAYRTARLSNQLSTYGAVEILSDPQVSAAAWRAVREVDAFHGRTGDVWRFCVSPSQAPGLVQRLDCEVLLDWGGALVWALMPEGSDARAIAAPYRGHAMLVRASSRTRARIPRFEPSSPGVAMLSAGIRRRFDPKGILNPGLMG